MTTTRCYSPLLQPTTAICCPDYLAPPPRRRRFRSPSQSPRQPNPPPPANYALFLKKFVLVRDRYNPDKFIPIFIPRYIYTPIYVYPYLYPDIFIPIFIPRYIYTPSSTSFCSRLTPINLCLPYLTCMSVHVDLITLRVSVGWLGCRRKTMRILLLSSVRGVWHAA